MPTHRKGTTIETKNAADASRPWHDPRDAAAERKRIQSVWRQMVRRCTVPACPDWNNYGGRGIEVCPEWHDFETFARWYVSQPGYAPGCRLELDRRDNARGYEPQNCRLVSRYENANNRRDNHYLTVCGIRGTLSTWARLFELKRSTLGQWVADHGDRWTAEKLAGLARQGRASQGYARAESCRPVYWNAPESQ